MVKNADNSLSPRTLQLGWLLPVLNNLNTPPANPKDGDRYRVTSVASGAWAGKEDNIAIWDADNIKWQFYALAEAQIWYDFTSQNWHYKSNAGVITQFDKIPLAISDVTGLQAALDGKAPLVHKANHVVGGSDPFIGGDLLDATARLQIAKAGVISGTRRKINFVEGANITITQVDDNAGEKVDVTIQSSAGGVHNLLDGNIDQDTVIHAAVQGSIIIGNATPKWDVLAIGSNGQMPISNGTTLVYRVLAAADIPAIPESSVTGLVADLAAKIATSQIGIASGVASLDGSAKIPIAQLQNLIGFKENGGTVSLGASNNQLIISAIPAYSSILVILRVTGKNVVDSLAIQFNGDTGLNYSYTAITNGTKLTQANVATPLIDNDSILVQATYFILIDNPQTKEKLATISMCDANGGITVGAVVWNNTVSLINSIRIFVQNAGNTMNSGTSIQVIGQI